MTQKPSYEELERRIGDLEKEFLKQKGTEETLRNSELWLERIFHTLEEVVLFVTPDRAIVRINEAGQKIFGYEVEELVGLSTELLHVDHEHYLRFGERIREAFASGKNANFEFLSKRKNGEIFTSRHSVSLLKDSLGKPMGIVSVVQELTQQEEVKKDLTRIEKKYQNLLEALNEGVWVIDKDAYTTYVNPRMAEMLDYTAEEMHGKHLFQFMDEEWTNNAKRRLSDRKEGVKEHHDFEFLKKDGTRLYADIATAPIRDEQGNYAGAIAGVMDITKRMQAEKALRESQKRYQRAEKMGNFGHWTRNLITNKAFWSPQVYQIFGVAPENFEPLWVNFLERIHPRDKERLREKVESALRRGSDLELEYRIVRPDGMVRHVRSSAEVMAEPDGKSKLLFGILFDVTEEKQLKTELDRHLLQLSRANRLASLGEMVAGVAHEINNPNSLITFNLPLMEDIWGFFKGIINEYAKKHPDAGMGRIPIDELSRDMDDILVSLKKGSSRINQVVGKLKAFAMPDEVQEVRLIEPNKVVEDTMAIYSTKLKIHADKIYFNLGEGPPPIWGYPLKLEQVLGNLIVNASHAIAGKTNGKISITTRYIKDLDVVLMEVEDNGHGMTKDQIEKIFDPFFTTRRQDGGTGLGLSISHGLVKEHHRVIGVISRPELGSRFTVFLPVQKGVQLTVQPNLLIIDDDPSVLKMLKSNFIKLDKRFVQTLSQAESVLEYLQGHPEIDLVLSDILMPDMNGWQLLKKIREHFPLMPVILYSGSQQALENSLDGIQPDFLIQKPFDRHRLIECIHKISRMKI